MSSVLVQDITRKADGSPWLPEDELAQFRALDISVSDTETTGLNRERNGLTEIASIRGMREPDGERLKLFHSFILPLKPAYQDYLAACADAKRDGKPAPAYDRRLYEYDIEPAALAVTGTEIVRKHKDGPITGLKVDGRHVTARPFYEVMDAFLDFTRNGAQDVYYNAPFDRPFLGTLIADVRAHRMAHDNAHQNTAWLTHEGLDKHGRELFREFRHQPYEGMQPLQQAQIVAAMHPLAAVPESFRNPSLYQCLYYGFLEKAGFGPSNTLDDATRHLVDPSHTKRGDHSGIEDVVLAARVALRLASPGIRDMADLYGALLARVDPQGTVERLPARAHSNGKEQVMGDIALHFSRPPEQIGENAVRLWQFFSAFEEAPRINSRVPQHVRAIDRASHTVVINAERKQPLSLNFLKKLIFFTQTLDSPLLYNILPFDSTGNRMDVVFRATDPATGQRRVVEDTHYGSLRANTAFLEAHPDQAADYITLIGRLRRTDRSVGLVLFKPAADGGVNVVVKGHLRAFGECVIHLPAGTDIPSALPSIQSELATQIKLGVIPQVGYFGERDDASLSEEDTDELAVAPGTNRREDNTSHAFVRSEVEPGKRAMTLTLTPIAFSSIAYRLGKDTDTLLGEQHFITSNGPISIEKQPDGHIALRGEIDAFHDFISLDNEGRVGEKPSNLIRDASWLLYRLERVPGTYAVHMEGHMAVLDQRDGVSLEALGLLYHVGVPFKAYGNSIKVDAHQLMKNAFHWSLALSRAQNERKDELDKLTRAAPLPASRSYNGKGRYQAPQTFLFSVQQALLTGKSHAMEMNERRDCWLLDHPVSADAQPRHHLLEKHSGGIRLVHRKKKIAVEDSDIKGPHSVRYLDTPQEGLVVQAPAPVLALASQQLKDIDPAQLSTSASDAWHADASAKPAVLKATQQASLFLYELSKQTGSERLSANSVTLEPPHHIAFHMPGLPFLSRPSIYDEILNVHQALADTEADGHIRHLQRQLPEPRAIDRRRSDLMQLTSELWQQMETIDALHTSLNRYLKLLGGAEHTGDPSALIFSDELRDDLASLGMLLHELSSTPQRKEGKHPALDALHTAQEKLSVVAFGADQLREDLGVARKALAGGADGSGGLRGRIGHAMAALWDEAAFELARHDPAAFSPDAMQAYEQRIHELLGDEGEACGYYARHAAMRSLLKLAASDDAPALQDKVAHYLLGAAFPAFNAEQRAAMIALYREGPNPATEGAMQLCFRTSGRKSPTPSADALLQQHYLLTHPDHIALPFDAWLTEYPRAQAEVEENICAAYQRRGRLYLDMAFIVNMRSEEGVVQQAEYLGKAEDCLMRAGWSEEKFAKALERTRKRHFSIERKQHVRAQLGIQAPSEQAGIKDLLATIECDGHEEQARAAMLAKGYGHYQRDARHKTEDILDPYHIHKQRHAMLGDIERALKEMHDLLMVKYHHVRDLQGLLVLLQQDPLIADRLSEDTHARVQEIGTRISHMPEMAGINDRTLLELHDALAETKQGIRTHLLQHLEAHKVPAEIRRDGAVVCDLQALQKMFAVWQQPEKKKRPAQPSTVPAHMYAWLDRASQRLFRCSMVEAVSLDKQHAGITCRIVLPQEAEERAIVWGQFRFACHGLGLHLPAMPGGEEREHTLSIPFLRRVVRGHTPLDAPATAHDVRKAIGAFAVSQGIDPADESSFVSRVMKNARKPNALQDALARASGAGADSDEISGLLDTKRQR